MVADSDTYFIKAGYQANPVQNTLDVSAQVDYWNDDRIESASRFQYDVYKDAVACLLSRTGSPALLDIGCGPPRKLADLLSGRDVRIHLVDQPNTEVLARRLLPHAHFTPVDLETIDIDLAERFDVVICADVIEHLLDPDPCLAFIRRHLRPGGLLFISTPERDVLRGPQCAYSPHPMHVREWNRNEFRRFIESRGFTLLKHYLLPQQRLPGWKKIVGRVASAVGMPPEWYSCQVAICEVR